jgi:hypothetical protein
MIVGRRRPHRLQWRDDEVKIRVGFIERNRLLGGPDDRPRHGKKSRRNQRPFFEMHVDPQVLLAGRSAERRKTLVAPHI